MDEYTKTRQTTTPVLPHVQYKKNTLENLLLTNKAIEEKYHWILVIVNKRQASNTWPENVFSRANVVEK